MEEDVRLAFIAESLNNYMKRVTETMRKRMRSMNTIDTRALINSLSYKVYQQNAEGNASLSFEEWGRFLDMGVRKGHPLGGVKATKAALAEEGNKKSKGAIKPRKIYSPVAYGNLNELMGSLAFGFTEEAINRIKNNIDVRN